jgi:hypothetical protein
MVYPGGCILGQFQFLFIFMDTLTFVFCPYDTSIKIVEQSVNCRIEL